MLCREGSQRLHEIVGLVTNEVALMLRVWVIDCRCGGKGEGMAAYTRVQQEVKREI